MSPLPRLLLASLLVGALVAAPGASAMYVITPLKVQVSHDAPQVGDTVTLTLIPDPESNHSSLAGQTVTVRYSFDPQEGEENSTPPEGGEAKSQLRDIGVVTLDAEQRASLAWTIPPELDDHNAFLTVVDEAGEEVGAGYAPVAVGDAPPIMMIMRGSPSESGPVESGPVESAPEQEPAGAVDETPRAEDEARDNATPAIGLAAFVAVAAIAALTVRRRS